MIKLLKKLVAAPSVSGRERKVSKLIEAELEPFADKIYRDNLNNLVAVKYATGAGEHKKIMLAAHMDEIGFLVNYIDSSGLIRISPIGGINFTAAAFSTVVFENGRYGVVVPEDKTKPEDYKADNFYIDIGASSAKEAEKYVKIGDFAAVSGSVTRLCGKRYSGRPFDDRIGCAILIDVMRKLVAPVYDCYFVFTVQEEVGCRGAGPGAFAIAPDYAIAYDVTRTGDAFSTAARTIKLGGGAAIKIKDTSVLCDIGFVEKMKRTAEANKIKYQLEILSRGGTDTSTMQAAGAGTVAGALSIPTRYIHTGTEMIDLADCEAISELTLKLITEEE